MVTVVPEIEHTDGVVLVSYETARPEDALATGLSAKVPLETKVWLAGDCALNVMVCAAALIVTDCETLVAGAYVPLPA